MPSAPDNRYEFTDASVARPLLTRLWFGRLFPLLPQSLAANVLTLASTGALLAVLIGALLVERLGATWFALLQLLCIQLYVAGDHLDGMQAKATGTTSPLGDFLDHHCDYWAGCILVFGWGAMLGSLATPLTPLMTLLMVAGFTVTYAQRAIQRRLHFTRWGTLEAIVIATLFYGTWALPGVRQWWSAPIWSGAWPRHSVVTVIGCVMAASVSVTTMRSLRGLPWRVAVQLAALVALAAWAQRAGVHPVWGWLLVSGAGAEMLARLMHAHTTPRGQPDPTWSAVLGAGLLWLLPPSTAITAAMILAAWLGGRYLLTLRRVVLGWRHHWVWVNADLNRAN